jgi:two-component system response regulator VicR
MPMSVYTSGQVAKIFGVSCHTVNKWIDTGLLKGFRIPTGGHRRVRQEDLDAFRKACEWPQSVTESRHSE